MTNTNVLISGAGIAGSALAYWLKRYGFTPTVVEQAPKPRTGGYLVDFRGTGIEVAERMGVMPQVRAEQWVPREMLFVNASDEVLGRVDLGRLFQETFDDPRRAQTQIMRSNLARILYDKSKEDAEYVFGDAIREVREDAEGVDVAFESGVARRFDLVVGADGIHSGVRALTFGDESRLSHYLGYHQAAFMMAHQRKDGTVLTYTEPGRFAALWCFPENAALAYFIFKHPEKLAFEGQDAPTRKRLLSEAFAGVAWKTLPELLEAMQATDDFFFDSADLIQLDRWSKGRVVLVGDAGFPAPLTAWGVSLALMGAYVLAGELKTAGGDQRAAFDAYERELRPFVEKKTTEARRAGLRLVPGSAPALWIRNQVLKLFSIPAVSRLAARMTYGRMFRESFPLKNYEVTT